MNRLREHKITNQQRTFLPFGSLDSKRSNNVEYLHFRCRQKSSWKKFSRGWSWKTAGILRVALEYGRGEFCGKNHKVVTIEEFSRVLLCRLNSRVINLPIYCIFGAFHFILYITDILRVFNLYKKKKFPIECFYKYILFFIYIKIAYFSINIQIINYLTKNKNVFESNVFYRFLLLTVCKNR